MYWPTRVLIASTAKWKSSTSSHRSGEIKQKKSLTPHFPFLLDKSSQRNVQHKAQNSWTMGMVFGKVDVAEPAFDVLLSRAAPAVKLAYDIRRYGTRYAIETEYAVGDKTSSPFFALAKYIGVVGEPENEGKKTIAMTAPVVREKESSTEQTASDSKAEDNTNDKDKGEKIAMTAPVVFESTSTKGRRKMQFILPAEYDSMEKIPKPTNPNVKVKALKPATGAVHKFTGNLSEASSANKAKEMYQQLSDDGATISEQEVMANFQYWGYNPPWTIPFLRRNEVWIELNESQVEQLVKSFKKSDDDNAGTETETK